MRGTGELPPDPSLTGNAFEKALLEIVCLHRWEIEPARQLHGRFDLEVIPPIAAFGGEALEVFG